MSTTYNLGDSKSPIVKVPPNFSDTVNLRVKKASFGKSQSSGKDQVTLETEIVTPDAVTLDGQEYVLAGQEITFYLGLSDDRVGKAKQSPMATTKEFHTKLGLPMELDPENLPYKEGLLFEFWLTSSEQKLQRKVGNKFEPILDENGQVRTLGWQWNNFVSNVLGPSKLKINEGF